MRNAGTLAKERYQRNLDELSRIDAEVTRLDGEIEAIDGAIAVGADGVTTDTMRMYRGHWPLRP